MVSRQTNSKSMFINAIGLFTPKAYAQEELLKRFDCGDNAFAQRINEGAHIDSRCYNVAPDVARDMTPDQRFAYGREQIPAMAYAALQNTGLDDKGLADLDAVICINSSEMLLPGPAEILGSKYNIGRSTALRFNLVGHGCAAVIPALQLAKSLVASEACHRVAIVASEPLISLHNPHAAERPNLIARIIFGEGAAAVILSDEDRAEGRLPEVLGYSSLLGQESLDHVTIGYQEGRRAARIDYLVPTAGKEIVAKAVEQLAASNGLPVAEIRHWAFHTGGRAVLDGCQEAIGLSDQQMAPSRYVLRHFGNMQSCSVIFSLHRLVESMTPGRGEAGALVAIGPGMLAGAFLLRW